MLSAGYDIGSSSVKLAIVDLATGQVVANATSPIGSMGIDSPHPGWAEQAPELWWNHIKVATAQVAKNVNLKSVTAIGLAGQMHGLVIIDKWDKVLRPSIIWCDSRAIVYGRAALKKLGSNYCLLHLGNDSPGNFTASKVAWVKDNEPNTYKNVAKFMLPTDWVAGYMTKHYCTTRPGLSEMILYDFKSGELARPVLDCFGINLKLIPEMVNTFGLRCKLTSEIASELGFAEGTNLSYRAGDQPNNAFSLKVLEPGEVAVTAGTSGVVYAIDDAAPADQYGRANTFLHVNDRVGVLMCLNGCGSLYSWIQNLLCPNKSYSDMDAEADRVPIGSDSLSMLPYGNGAERTLKNANPGATIRGLDFNRHKLPQICRAALESIAFGFKYSMNIMSNDMHIPLKTVRAGYANMFKSSVFAQIFADVTGCGVEIFNTDGSVGAALGAGVGCGYFSKIEYAFTNLKPITVYTPNQHNKTHYAVFYALWLDRLNKVLQNS